MVGTPNTLADVPNLADPDAAIVADVNAATNVTVKPLQLNSGAALGKYVAAVLERNLELLSGAPNPNSSSEPQSNTYNLCAKAMRHLFEECPELSCAKKNVRHN